MGQLRGARKINRRCVRAAGEGQLGGRKRNGSVREGEGRCKGKGKTAPHALTTARRRRACRNDVSQQQRKEPTKPVCGRQRNVRRRGGGANAPCQTSAVNKVNARHTALRRPGKRAARSARMPRQTDALEGIKPKRNAQVRRVQHVNQASRKGTEASANRPRAATNHATQTAYDKPTSNVNPKGA